MRLLAIEGLQVDCAATGAQGVSMARLGQYDAIILDLRLPDMSGVTALADMRSAGVSAPVLILTGYPDLAVAVACMRLGAYDVKPKTLLLEDGWTALVCALVEAERHSDHVSESPVGESCQENHCEREHLDQVIEGIRLVATRDQLVALLIRSTTDPLLGSFGFITCCSAFRRTMMNDSAAIFTNVAAEATDVIKNAAENLRAHWPRRAREAIAALHRKASRGCRPTEDEVASDFGIEGSHLGRLIHQATGIRFRVWRKALFVRPAVSAIATSDEHVAQIAYRLHYEHPTQFTHDFHQLLGLTPTEYRQLWRRSLAD